MIKDTAYSLEVHLQQIDEKLTRLCSPGVDPPDASIDLRDEKAVTQQCLRVCEEASTYIETLATRESSWLQHASRTGVEDDAGEGLEARLLTRQALESSRATFLGVINCLGQRLQSVVANQGDDNQKERLRLQEDINVSKQCLHMCKVASEMSHEKVHRVGEALAEDNSDQVVVTTLADLFEVQKAVSRGHSAQLVATLTPENFETVVQRRYSSRFAALPDRSVHSHTESATSPVVSNPQRSERSTSLEIGKDARPLGPEPRRDRPNPNEMRKRFGNGENEQKAAPRTQ